MKAAIFALGLLVIFAVACYGSPVSKPVKHPAAPDVDGSSVIRGLGQPGQLPQPGVPDVDGSSVIRGLGQPGHEHGPGGQNVAPAMI